MLPLKSWEAKNLDAVLRSGDRLYCRINSQHDYLLVNDIPDVITEFGEQFSISKNGEMFGMLIKGQFNGIGQELDVALKSMIQHNKLTHAIMCIGQPPALSMTARLQGSSACALLLIKDNYYIFDPHSRNKHGKPDDSGAAVLLNFKTIRHLCSYIRDLGISLNCHYYEITIISVNHFLLGKYVDDQKRKQAEKIRQSKTDFDAEKSFTGDKIKLSKRERETLRCDKNHLLMMQKHEDTTYKQRKTKEFRIKETGKS